MKVLITGGSGFIGSALTSYLTARMHQVIRLVRRPPGPEAGEIFWNPLTGELDAGQIEGFDAVIHLAAENLATGRWTRERKSRILESRVSGTNLLSVRLAGLRRPPKVMISASAIGYYGDRGEEVLDEGSGAGSGFLAEVCRRWEEATAPATTAGIRVVLLRIGMILSAAGGALPRMLTPFRFGFGARMGSGRQFMSWIALDDVLEIVGFVLGRGDLGGALNAVAPGPVTNLEFTRTLARVLRRPAVAIAPALALRLLFGEMSEQVLLSSARVHPARLLAAGFQFRYRRLEPALRHELSGGKPANPELS
jgi:uncharacterized protein (TIGR01777 family)